MANEEYFRDRDKKLEAMVESKANDKQIAGNHYRNENAKFQHWDLMAVNNVGYFEGQVTKYISRWKNKNGAQDLEKATHYLQKMIEVVSEGILPIPDPREPHRLSEYRLTHPTMDRIEFIVFKTMLTWTSLDDLINLQESLEDYLRSQ